MLHLHGYGSEEAVLLDDLVRVQAGCCKPRVRERMYLCAVIRWKLVHRVHREREMNVDSFSKQLKKTMMMMMMTFELMMTMVDSLRPGHRIHILICGDLLSSV